MACNSVAIALAEVGDVGAIVRKMMENGMSNEILDRIVELMSQVEGVQNARKNWGSLELTFKGESYDLNFRGNRWVINSSYGVQYNHQEELDKLLVECTQFVGAELIALQTIISLEQMNAQVLEETTDTAGVRRVKFRMLV